MVNHKLTNKTTLLMVSQSSGIFFSRKLFNAGR